MHVCSIEKPYEQQCNPNNLWSHYLRPLRKKFVLGTVTKIINKIPNPINPTAIKSGNNIHTQLQLVTPTNLSILNNKDRKPPRLITLPTMFSLLSIFILLLQHSQLPDLIIPLFSHFSQVISLFFSATSIKS